MLPKTPSFQLNGKRALVVGASSGIGLACATAIAEAGATTVLAARRQDKLSQAVFELTEAGYEANALALDVTDHEAVRDHFNTHDPYDVIINSAGLARHGPALETTASDYEAVMAINVRAAYFLAQMAAQRLIEARKPGSIVTISSQMAHVGGIDRAVYCASKHAVEGFTKAMAIEWGKHGVRINTVCPTFIRTELTQSTFDNPERRAWIEDKIKLGRVGEVTDIMGPVVFLASEASALITGSSLLVDGGWTAE